MEVKNIKNNKAINKSIIRYVWVQMKEQNAKTLAQKKEVFVDVLTNSSVKPWIKEHMIRTALKQRTHDDFDRYLVNSKNYFEKNIAV